MSNSSCWILVRLLKSRARSPNGNILFDGLLIVLFLLLPALPSATGQTEYRSELDNNFNSLMKLTLVLFVCGAFFIAFFSLHARHYCLENNVASYFRPPATNRLQMFARGLDTSVIESFPVFIYSVVKNMKIGNVSLQCAVCISEFEDDECLRLLPKCNHVFHPNCIDAWLASHTTCPVCRANLTPDKLDGDSERSHESTHLPNDREEPRSVLSEVQNQVSIDVAKEGTQNSPVAQKFPRSHSTGHSLIQPGENCDRYTLRLPHEVRKQIVTLKRTQSCEVVFPQEESSRRGCWGDSEASNRGRSGNQDRLFGRSDRWMFKITPPFIAKTSSIGKSDGSHSSTRSPV